MARIIIKNGVEYIQKDIVIAELQELVNDMNHYWCENHQENLQSYIDEQLSLPKITVFNMT